MTFLEKLEQLKNSLPLHMPGHKRNTSLAPYLKKLAADVDITEITDFDNLHSPEGIILEYMEKAKKLWKSQNSFFLVNGSSGGVLAGIRACTNFGDTVLVARSCHKSVYHALELCGLKTEYIYEKTDSQTGIKLPIDPSDIENKIKSNNKIKALILTTPTYEGVISDIEKITKLCHENKIAVVLDAAHGAHLPFSSYFNHDINILSADIVIQSLHKTLPCLTQTAIAHVNSDLINLDEFKRNLSIFQTSSPSYILMASVCECIDLLDNKKEQLFTAWQNNLEDFYKKAKALKYLKIVDFGLMGIKQDKSKIIIDCTNCNINGFELLEILNKKYSIDLEMALDGYALAMTSIADTSETFERFLTALTEIDQSLCLQKSDIIDMNFESETVNTIFENLGKEKETVDILNSVGKVSAEYLWVYPPGIPAIVPGEVITKSNIEKLLKLYQKSAKVEDSDKLFPYKINVNKT